MHALQDWIFGYLRKWGFLADNASELRNLFMLVFIIVCVIVVDYLCRVIFIGIFKRIAIKTKTQWDDLVIERGIIHKMMHIFPAILLYILLPLAFPPEETPKLLNILQILTKIYIIAVCLRFSNAMLRLVNEFYSRRESSKERPIKGFIQLLQILVFFIGFIIIISVLIKKSPATLFAGLGASAAILMLVFKDTILGFVAGIQLSYNNMLRPGDWITMPKYGADGTVLELTLNAIKIQNFDNTIVTVPPYALVTDSFQNWRGMTDSDGRRIKRFINIDLNSITFCTPEMLDEFRKIALITDYINLKEAELKSFNQKNGVDLSITANGRRETNIGVFRNYLINYLRNLAAVNTDMTLMVRQLQPTEFGLPLELYFFSRNKDWVIYEGIQADVFDHVLAVVPEFGLRMYQQVSGSDIRFLATQEKQVIVKTENK